jgi:hypothetical protein
MGWLKQLERPFSHDCVLPSPYAAAPGSVWQCDDCGKKWRIVVHVGVAAERMRRADDVEWELIPNPPAREGASSSDATS